MDGATFNAADDAPVTAFDLLQLNAGELGFRPIYPSVYTARDAGRL